MVRVGNAHHSLAIYISKKLKFYYYEKTYFYVVAYLDGNLFCTGSKVYLKIGEGRVTAESNLAVWVWEGKNNFCTNKEWPGDKLTEKETIEGADYFVYTVNTEGSYNLIFNNNEKENANTNRTADILGLAGDCTFVLNADWNFTKTEGAPGAETPESVETYTVQLAGNAYGTWNAPVTFAYNAETKEYVYEETETAKLADEFKINIVEAKAWLSNDAFVNAALNNELGFQNLYDGKNMKITDAADYDKITLTVKNDNGTWKLKVVGEKPDKVQIAGKFNSWNGVDMVSNPNGTYTYEVEENMNALSEGFGIVINGVFYAGNTVLDLDGDAVVLTGNPGPGNDLTLIAEGDVASVILTVAKDGDNWTVKAATGKTSSVADVDAAGVVIAATNGEIVVDGAQSVAVYTAAGALVSTDARTRVAAGLYIVRADNVVKKVIVK